MKWYGYKFCKMTRLSVSIALNTINKLFPNMFTPIYRLDERIQGILNNKDMLKDGAIYWNDCSHCFYCTISNECDVTFINCCDGMLIGEL